MKISISCEECDVQYILWYGFGPRAPSDDDANLEK